MFPVITPLGRSLRAGGAEPEIAPGVVVQKLTKPVHLIEIETKSGDRLTLSPESVFSLAKQDGRAMLFNPPDYSFGKVERPHWFLPIEDAQADYRVWFIIGSILASGSFSADRNRPARLLLRREDSATRDEIAAFVRMAARTCRGAPYQVKVKHVADCTVISSRVLDTLLRPFISPKVHNLLFDLMALPKDRLHGFIAGMLSGMKRDAQGRAKFVHRNSDVIRQLHSAFHDRVGIPVELRVSTMEPSMQTKKTVSSPHALVLRPSALGLCQEVLRTTDRHSAQISTGLRLDDIVRVTPAGRRQACIVVAEKDDAPQSTANWFVFNPVFEIDPMITDLATDLADPAQPEDEHPATCRCEVCRFWGA